jgi:serine/threonine protein kinase
VDLWATVNRRDETVEEFRAEGPMSVGAAKTLGRGLSFDVILIPVEDRTKRRLQLRSPFVVYKKLRGLTDKLDTIERGELLQAVLLEIRVLTHPPLKTHPNIIKLLHLIWEPDSDLLDRAWPIIVLEHAENGTLADFQRDYLNLPFSLKRQLCVDVGSGLLALHASGIVHGDLKSENILICDTDSEERVVAKLADFGCAITDLETSDTLKLPAFTLPWNAPECHDQLPRDLLKYTDVYSYGLLVWRITLNGANPFKLIDGLAGIDTADFRREVEMLKLEDRVLQMAKSTLKHPFCGAGVETYVISSALELTLRLDASTRDLPGSLKFLSERGQATAFPNEPLMQYEYENVCKSLLHLYLGVRHCRLTL